LGLICLDLEYGWRSPHPGGSPTLADYVARFPELVSLDRLPLDVIGEEYRARRRWGDRPTHSEFLAPFGERLAAIRRELLRIDAEIDLETTGSGITACPTPLDPAPVADPTWLSDRDFLLRRLIGAGGMGKVYAATRREDGRGVAVKFLRKPLLAHPSVVRRFVGEARTVAGLGHPNIVGTEGLGRTPGGSYFLVMDLVAGPNLDQLLRGAAIPPAQAIGWTHQIATALAHAHERGVVHCDLKPANLLLDETGLIRVTDFGLARSLTGATPWAAEVEGTVPFMAPEQASTAWGPIDQRTDVYGIGAVLFTLLTGRPPVIGGTRLDLLAEVAGAAPVISPTTLRPDLPGPLTDLCRKCLAKAPDERFASARDLRLALEGLLIKPPRSIVHPR